MQLPGLVTIRPDQHDLLKQAADMVGESFMEEPWFISWLSALDQIGTTPKRKLEILQALFLGEFVEHAPFEGVYATEDMAACAGGYLSSELRGHDHEKLENRGDLKALSNLLTEEESRLLDERADEMATITNFSWVRDMAGEADHIYIYAWAVDARKRGSGALRRLIEPFFSYADEHGLDIYLDCFSDRLQSIYEHLGFELIGTASDPRFDIYERFMVRRSSPASSL